MFNYTRGVLNKTIEDIKNLLFAINISSMLIYIVYLVYAIITNSKTLLTNIPLLAVVSLYFIFYIVKHDDIDKDSQNVKKKIKKIYVWIKIVIKAVSLAITILGFYHASTTPNFFSIALTAIMLIGWLLSILFEIVSIIIQKRANLFIEAFEMDIDKIKAPFVAATKTIATPFVAAKNQVSKIMGKEIPQEETQINNEKTPNSDLIEKWALDAKAKRIAKKAFKKAAKKQS